ncbi:MAG: hypothetical protein K6E21_01680 [Bacilli bacterium]|nr:hypothetical protein [Bacilli bacterium]
MILKKAFVSIAVLMVVFGFENNQHTSACSAQEQFENDYYSVVSYDDVFEKYYSVAAEETKNNNSKIESFENFKNGYYESNSRNLVEYTNSVIQKSSAISDEAYGGDGVNKLMEADYILKGLYFRSERHYEFDHCNSIPEIAFHRDLHYNFDYSFIKEGDIVVETNTILGNIGHVGYVLDVDRKCDAKIFGNPISPNSFIRTVDAVGRGVMYGFLDDGRMVDYGCVILRPKSSGNYNVSNDYVNKIKNVVSPFIKRQVGKPYTFDFLRSPHLSNNSEDWFCSELVNAAFKYAGISILDNLVNALPSDFLKSSLLMPVQNNVYAKLDYLSKISNGNKKFVANIEITNPNKYPVNLTYTTVSTNRLAASQWCGSSLSFSGISIGPFSTRRVCVETNKDEYISFRYNWLENGKSTTYITYCTNFKTKDDLASDFLLTMTVQINQIKDGVTCSVASYEDNSVTIRFFNLTGIEKVICIPDSLSNSIDINGCPNFINVQRIAPSSYIDKAYYYERFSGLAAFLLKGLKVEKEWISYFYIYNNQKYFNHGQILSKENIASFSGRCDATYNTAVSVASVAANRYYEKRISLLPGQKANVEITFEKSGKKVIQSFGNKDTYFELYDWNGNLVASNDDGGYSYNAFIVSDLFPNVKYSLIVNFYNESEYGYTKISITQINQRYGIGSEQTYQSFFNKIEVSSSGHESHFRHIKDSVNPFVVRINNKGRYKINTGYDGAYVDTYLYFVNPCTDELSLKNDDGGDNNQALLYTDLICDLYYVIPCLYYTSATYEDYIFVSFEMV